MVGVQKVSSSEEPTYHYFHDGLPTGTRRTISFRGKAGFHLRDCPEFQRMCPVGLLADDVSLYFFICNPVNILVTDFAHPFLHGGYQADTHEVDDGWRWI